MRVARRATWIVAVVALAFLVWIAFVGELSLQELAMGAACALVCGTTSLFTWGAMDLSLASSVVIGEPQTNDRIEFVKIRAGARFIRGRNANRGDAQ